MSHSSYLAVVDWMITSIYQGAKWNYNLMNVRMNVQGYIQILTLNPQLVTAIVLIIVVIGDTA